ncbi:MAG TPA: HAMP domain-containing sensor histidine kinase [bacterium]|nr:HAMP domain-containing sensor histidine kinase [bacterium]
MAALQLHYPTLLVALALVYIGSVAFALLLFLLRRRFPGAGLWILAQALLAVGAVGVALQSLHLPYGVLAVSNVAMLASVIMMGNSIWRFRFGGGFPRWTYVAIPASLAVWFAMMSSGVGLRIIVFSGALGILASLVSLLLLLRPESQYRAAYLVAGLYFVSVALTGFGRALLVACGHVPQSIAASGSMDGYIYMLGLLTAFFNLFGYSLMASARIEHDLFIREDEKRRQNDELKETLATKDTLIAILGHDLRAPVWSASRYVRGHLVEFEGDLNTKRENIETLAEGLERISGLLDSLLEWAMCASGRIKLTPEPISVAKVALEAAADLQSTAKAKGVNIEPPDGDGLILADPRALATVFRNILSNAVKYSLQGGAVRFRAATMPDDPARLGLAISDEGVGMRPEQIAKLFVPGRTILTLGTGGEQGKGFGLATSKLFVESMGGTMHVESEPGRGTTFVIIFPISDR